MTDREEIERLLNQTGRTLEGLPKKHTIAERNDAAHRPGEWCEIILHQSDVIELLVGALRDALDNQPKWISVKERLTEPFVRVLVQMPGETPFQTVREGYISNDGVWTAGYFKREPDEVTHWMPLPEPPKED